MTKILTQSVFLLVAVAFVACSSTPVRRSVKESWNDTMTASKIRYKLMKDKDVQKSHMHVQVFRGEVTLTGRAVSDAEKARAETVAKSVKRVTAVENYVHVVGNDNAKAAPAVAKIQETDKIKIEEKIIKEVPLVSVKPAAAATATVSTIRESTGERQPTIVTASKVAAKPAAAKSAEPKLATVRKADRADKPVVAAIPKVEPKAPSATASQVGMSAAPSTKVVGQSKTGLPWDGEVYEDDASRVTPISPAASRTPVKTQAVVATPVTSTPVGTGDDLAKEAAAELEKLRQKK